MNKIFQYIKKPKQIIIYLMNKGYFKFIDDKTFIKLKYRLVMGKKLNLNDPQTFNEKLQWLKIYNRNPLYITLVDKYEVREYIKKNLGEEYLIPLLGVYDKVEDINFEKLPNKFVIKCNHDSGGVIVCKDKNNFNFESAKRKITKSLKRNYYYSGREWPYKNVKPKIIIEQYIEDKNGFLPDYKFYCFNGKCDYVMVCTERETGNPKFYYFNEEWNLAKEMSNDGMKTKESFKCPKPKNINNMFSIARNLSKKFPFIRVDLYNIDGKIYFGEFTFFPSSGFDNKRTERAQKYLNKMLKLNKKEM